MEDKRCLAFMESKLCNMLTTHLSLVVNMFVQWFSTFAKFLVVLNALSNGEHHINNIAIMIRVH